LTERKLNMLPPDTDEDKLVAILESADRDRLPDVFKELHSECRALRDTELKLVPAFIAAMALIAAANILLISRANDLKPPFIIAVSGVSIAFCLLLFFLFWWRFEHDHVIYDDLFRRIRIIRKQWGFTGFFPNRQYGHSELVAAGLGSGYKQNQRVLLVTTIAVVSLILCGVVYVASKA